VPVRLGRAPLPLIVTAGAAASALLMGLIMAYDLPKGVGLMLGLAFLPVLVFDLALALSIYVALVFIAQLPFTGPAETLVGLLVLAAWAGALRHRLALFREHPALPALLAAFFLWLGLSATWASDAGAATSLLLPYGIAIAVFVVVATFVRTERDYWVLATGFLVGAVLLTAVGFAEQGLTTARSATEVATQVDAGRLSAGGGDPNYLAAGLLPALVIGAGLFMRYRGALTRLVLGGGLLALPVGIVASQSRGAMVAAVVVLVAGLVLARDHRTQVLAMIVAMSAVAGMWLAANPAAAQRIVSFDDGGAGRTELWRVGWSMAGDYPVIGVGLNNFQKQAPAYSRTTGALEDANLISEQPRVVHNIFLQFLVETGVIGLALFFGVVGACLRAAWRAARRFAADGRRAMATQARLVIIAQLGYLAASFFLSNASDIRFWILLALGPGLLAVARGERGTARG